MTENEKDVLLNELYRIISLHPGGIPEFDLLEILRNRQWPLFGQSASCDTLELFQTHFLLFHLLYALRERLRQRREADLDIHCLKIVLTPFIAPAGHLPDFPDYLREYYADLSQLESNTRETVGKMLDDFWEKFARLDRRPDALKILGLEDPVNQTAIKQRFRELALRHHPDRGGNPELFRKISEAASILLD